MVFNSRRSETYRSLPDGPRDPALVQLARYLNDPVFYLLECKQIYGPVFTLSWPGMPPMVYFSEPAAIREIFQASPSVLCAGRSNSVLDFVAGPRSVARLDGRAHKKRRQVVIPPFSRLAPYIDTMRTNAEASFFAAGSQVIGLQDLSQALALRNLIDCTLGFENPSQADRLHTLMIAFMQGSLNPVMATLWMAFCGVNLRKVLVKVLAPLVDLGLAGVVPFATLADTIRQLDALLYAEIETRRAAGAGSRDLLSRLVHRRDDDGDAMDDQDLRDEMMALLVAGHETTSTTLDWCIVEALSRPSVLAAMREEVERVVDGPVTAAMLPELTYLTAVIDECLRLHPPVPAVGRYVAREIKIAGTVLPKGCVASPSLLLLHRDPKAWIAPHAFRPQRFLNRTAPPRDIFAPFGGGPRICLGRTFALFQIKVVLATLLANFEVEPQVWPEPRMVQRGLFTGVCHPIPVILRAKKRRSGSVAH